MGPASSDFSVVSRSQVLPGHPSAGEHQLQALANLHTSGKLENTFLYLFVLICLYYKKGKKETSHTFFTQFSAGLKSMLTSTLLLKSN
jgi:hypothetical protein